MCLGMKRMTFHFGKQKQWKKLSILDTYGVVIPSSWKPMTDCFKSYGIPIIEEDAAKCIASSKKDHITNIIREKLKLQDEPTQFKFISLILRDFPSFQLEWFKKNPTSIKIIDLDKLQEYQKDKQNALVFTSMFPNSIMNFLSTEFYKQGICPNAIYNSSSVFTTRSSLVQHALNVFPAEKNYFLVDTIADADEIGKNFPQVDVIGVMGHSAEPHYNLASRFIKEANVKEVIYSSGYLLGQTEPIANSNAQSNNNDRNTKNTTPT